MGNFAESEEIRYGEKTLVRLAKAFRYAIYGIYKAQKGICQYPPAGLTDVRIV